MKTNKKKIILSALCFFLILTSVFSQIEEFSDEKSINDYKMLHDLSPSITKPFLYQPDWILIFEDKFEDISSLGNWTQRNIPRGHQLCLFQDENKNVSINTTEKKLYIIPKKENVIFRKVGGYEKQYYYTSGELNSNDKFLYGYFEIRCKLPRFKGAHSAFWLLSKLSYIPEEDGWDAWEIDIFEASSSNLMETRRNSISSNYSSYIIDNPDHGIKGFFINNDEPTNSLSDKFYTYALEWTPYELTYYIDDRIIRRVSTIENPYIYYMDSCQVRICLEIDWWNPPDEGTELEPFIIDYVRVYKRDAGIYIPKPEINGNEIVTYDWNTYWVNPHPNGIYTWEIDENGELNPDRIDPEYVQARLKPGKTTTVLTLREKIDYLLTIDAFASNQKIITNRLPTEFTAYIDYWICDKNFFTQLRVKHNDPNLPPDATNIINKFDLYKADRFGDKILKIDSKQGEIGLEFDFTGKVSPHRTYVVEHELSSDQYYSSSRRVIYPTLNSAFCPRVLDNIHENNLKHVWAKSVVKSANNIWKLYKCDLLGYNHSFIYEINIPPRDENEPADFCYYGLHNQLSEYYYLDHTTSLEDNDCFPDKTRRMYFYIKDVENIDPEDINCYIPSEEFLTGIDENICNNGFIIPNPVNNYFTINFTENNIINVNYINIFDSKGSLIKSWNKPEYNSDFDISYLKPGLYFILIVTNNQSYYDKLIKN
jgi:beta-glucanase (GH16 family)